MKLFLHEWIQLVFGYCMDRGPFGKTISCNQESEARSSAARKWWECEGPPANPLLGCRALPHHMKDITCIPLMSSDRQCSLITSSLNNSPPPPVWYPSPNFIHTCRAELRHLAAPLCDPPIKGTRVARTQKTGGHLLCVNRARLDENISRAMRWAII